MDRRTVLKGIGTASIGALAGCIGSANPTSEGDDTSPITRPRSSLLVALEDFDETGWQALDNPDLAEFEKIDGRAVDVVYSNVIVADDVATAKDAFDIYVDDNVTGPGHSTTSFDIGVECIGYEPGDSFVVFRDANAIGLIQYQVFDRVGRLDGDLERAAELAATSHGHWR